MNTSNISEPGGIVVAHVSHPTTGDYIFYYVAMFLILVIGLPGNALAILVLRHRDHKNKTSTPLLINIAVVDLFILIFGYPTAIVSAQMQGSIGSA